MSLNIQGCLLSNLHWNLWGYFLLKKDREPGAESEGLDASWLHQAGICPLHTTRLCNAGAWEEDTLFQDFSCNWLCGEVRFICCLPKTPWQQYEECSVSHPRPIPATSSHQLTQQTTLLKFLLRIKQLFRSWLPSPPNESSVYSVSQATLTSARVLPQTGSAHPGLQPGQSPVQTAAPGGRGPLWRRLARCQAIENQCA